MIYDIFLQRFDVDERNVVWEFSFPFMTGRFGLVPCDLQFWIMSFLLLSAECIFNCFFALIIYRFIVPHQKTIQSYLLGYGVILPVILVSPFVLLPFFRLTNMALLLCLVGGTVSLVCLRCIEAMHGTLPSFAESSLHCFLLYYASALQFEIDESTGKAIPSTREGLLRKIYKFLNIFFCTSLLYSILMPFDYKVFPVPPSSTNLRDLLHWGNLGNNFLIACLTSLTLESGVVGLGILTSLVSGLNVIDFADSPLTKSESPSDFWSRRWNRVTQSGLRRGVYLPLLQSGLSRTQAAFGTFVFSGLLHEYVLLVMTQRAGQPNNPTGTPFVPNYGHHLHFFLWCGLVILLEKLTKGTTPVIWIQKFFPQPVRTALVLLTVLPVSHLFTDEYIASCFYSDLAMGFVKVKYLGQ